jgi:hypothetical protein
MLIWLVLAGILGAAGGFFSGIAWFRRFGDFTTCSRYPEIITTVRARRILTEERTLR